MTRRIVLAGFGNMGRALARGWIAARVDPHTITAVDPEAAARDAAAALGLEAVAVAQEVVAPIDVAVLAVKPADLAAVLRALPPALLYLSIAAGRSTAEIEAIVGKDRAVVRAMPNTPAAIGQGIAGLCAGRRVGAADRATATELMSAVGAVEWLDDEADMDALTAVSGSGPAYVFLLIEALRVLAKSKKKPAYDFYAVFTVQEEVGLRGANVSALEIKPDFGFGLDTTIAYDVPGSTPHERCTSLGEGAGIKIMDSSVICDYRMVAYMKKTADKHKIKWQPEILAAGGTDTAGLQRMVPGGSIAGAVSVPTRHIHQTIETVNKKDLQASIDLLVACVCELDKGDWKF